jgi:hypothetical protein
MSPLPTTSSSARTALMYVTVGALVVVWTGVWYIYLNNNPPETNRPYYLCAGLLISGLTLLGIGLGLGRIGSSARQAEVPVHSVTNVPAAPASNGPPAVTPANAPAGAQPVPPLNGTGQDAALAPPNSVQPPMNMS